MRVLVNALSARKGGIVTYTNNLLAAFQKRGIDINIAVSEDFETEYDQSISRLNVARFSPLQRLIWEQTSWRKFVKNYNPDILFSSANFGLLNCPVNQILLLREGGLFDPFYLANMTAPLGVWNGINRYFRRRLMLLSAMSANQIITPTKAMRDMVSLWHPEITEKCSVNPYGTINDAFKPRTDQRKWREDGVCRLIYVSVYYPHKVPRLLCQAVDQLIETGFDCHATITMAPSEFAEMQGSDLDEVIVSDAARRGIVSLGNYKYDDLPELYRSQDVFVFPSVSETFGHPMAEAMSSGLPVVVADTPVNREICGDAALYFEPFSVTGLVDCIQQLDGDKNLRDSLPKIGRERALERFGWEDHVDRLIETMEKMLSKQA
ncbi:MAG: glycosyltransferase family 4 protein [Rhodospirillaceae bacterium]|jgi:glycosyltransferase involved in cell wall biosynthesis|nr:glycosyltransferase family 4 protein [Rhodospirillaceae bacterium]